jgi:phosphopantothenoylcysteine decarboxylase/phosphopantothenate--cysteine ligase
MILQHKKIIVGVTGSIAAYKIAFLVRLLVKEGAEVQVIMTEDATAFITPLTLATLSKKPVLINYQKDTATGEWNNHVELGLWADLLLICPCTANTLAKMAMGLCDNLLMAVYLSARCPVWVAPAMDLDMYAHPSTQRNLATLAQYPHHRIIEATEGELASGLSGKGRMEEPEQLLTLLKNYFSPTESSLKGKKILITAGGTREAIDPVRFITNHSTGKMGYAIAEELAQQGAIVTLISGVTHLAVQHPTIQKIDVESAEEMYNAVMQQFEQQAVIIHAAAVADYTPVEKSATKIKKNDNELFVHLKKTKDIAAAVGQQLRPHQVHVGFALETNNAIENAKGKLERKNLDFIVLNTLQDAGAGFGHDTNKIYIIDRNGTQNFELKHKKEVAKDIVAQVALHLAAKTESR